MEWRHNCCHWRCAKSVGSSAACFVEPVAEAVVGIETTTAEADVVLKSVSIGAVWVIEPAVDSLGDVESEMRMLGS